MATIPVIFIMLRLPAVVFVLAVQDCKKPGHQPAVLPIFATNLPRSTGKTRRTKAPFTNCSENN
jgi:hypothetical protein